MLRHKLAKGVPVTQFRHLNEIPRLRDFDSFSFHAVTPIVKQR
jgi:hypothetical protein